MQNNTGQKKCKHRVLTGVVISNKMQKTIVVKVTRLTKHSIYRKTIKRYSSFKAHDERGLAKIGDTVRIEETRPISKEKRWRLIEASR
jgi:small subunit ribosomal protein S17